MIATARHFDWTDEDPSCTSTEVDRCTEPTTADNDFYITPDEVYIYYETFGAFDMDMEGIDHIQAAVAMNCIRAQAILGYFAAILPAANHKNRR